ncbi:NTP transferase domain-containing protein [candidate division KSB1 bacterium]|nr:NTP transferase domain-containing protein [candidate division KSB1 bacterium]
MNDLGVIILAAGKGKRMGGDHPKVLTNLGEKPLIDYVISTAVSLKPSIIAVVVGFEKEKVIDYVSAKLGVSAAEKENIESDVAVPDGAAVRYAYQDEQLGTGHAVQKTKNIFKNFKGDIVLLYGDVPLISKETIHNLIDHHEKTGAAATILSAEYDDPSGYGRVIRNDSGELLKIIEEKDTSPSEKGIAEVNTGTYVFRAEQLFDNLDRLSRDNAQKELYITDMIGILREQGKIISSWKTKNSEETFGINTPEDLERLHDLLKKL